MYLRYLLGAFKRVDVREGDFKAKLLRALCQEVLPSQSVVTNAIGVHVRKNRIWWRHPRNRRLAIRRLHNIAQHDCVWMWKIVLLTHSDYSQSDISDRWCRQHKSVCLFSTWQYVLPWNTRRGTASGCLVCSSKSNALARARTSALLSPWKWYSKRIVLVKLNDNASPFSS